MKRAIRSVSKESNHPSHYPRKVKPSLGISLHRPKEKEKKILSITLTHTEKEEGKEEEEKF